MVSFEEEEKNTFDDNESDNNADHTMEDVSGEAGGMADDDGEAELEVDNDEGEAGNDQEDDQDVVDSPSRSHLTSQGAGGPAVSPHTPMANGVSLNHASAVMDESISTPTMSFGTSYQQQYPNASGMTLPIRPSVRSEALVAKVYDIIPTIAAPHSTSINAVAATPDMRWVFSGGADGYIRKFNWVDTANGKLMLTVAQRHPFVDSVTKAGVLLSYWENEDPSERSPSSLLPDEPPSLSPVHSLAVNHQGLWLLSGLESGGINLQSIRHDEGKRITCLRKHTSAVSVLTLAQDELSVLSGSWDRTIHDWDLNTGQIKQTFSGNGGQTSAIEFRPLSSLPVPEESGTEITLNGTFTSNTSTKKIFNDSTANGIRDAEASLAKKGVNTDETAGSPVDSLFGDKDSLFGDDKDGPAGAPPGAAFGDDDDDEFSRAIANGIQQQEDEEAEAEVRLDGVGGPVQSLTNHDKPASSDSAKTPGTDETYRADGSSNHHSALTNGMPPNEEAPFVTNGATSSPNLVPSSESTFLEASMDGTIRIWDRRQPNPIARISKQRAPPWCMSACWSPDGNHIYAGRRNNCVEEYSLHKGFREPSRVFKFPFDSGSVSVVKAMPNGRHLVLASHDIIRLYDLKAQDSSKPSVVPFLIVPGHRGGMISQLHIDPTCTFMISTGGNRGWEGFSTEVLLGYEIAIGS